MPGTGASNGTRPPLGRILALVSFQNRGLFACSQAGLVNKLSDTAIWGLAPVAMAKSHLSAAQIGAVGGIYAATWGVLQLGSGVWSDRVGRKLPTALGQTLGAVGLAFMAVAHSFGMWMLVALLTGLGTALLYPVLLSAVGDAAPAAWRSSALGVYRMRRDGGYAIGGLLLGLGADRLGIQGAAVPLAALVFLSALAVVFLMRETRVSQPFPS
jgi:MFS family permease